MQLWCIFTTYWQPLIYWLIYFLIKFSVFHIFMLLVIFVVIRGIRFHITCWCSRISRAGSEGNTWIPACDMKPYPPYDNVDNEFVTLLNIQEKIVEIICVSVIESAIRNRCLRILPSPLWRHQSMCISSCLKDCDETH